jgi:hypothetical protein
MNSVRLFDEQSQKIGRMKIGKLEFLFFHSIETFLFIYSEMFIYSIILQKKKKLNGVYQMIHNINFYLIGLSMNFLENKNF